MLDSRLNNLKTGIVKLMKDEQNLIGISIGGGSPHCPVLYVIQVFDNSPVYNSGLLEPGDEILSVNGCKCRGWAKHDLAKYIQSCKAEITIEYRKFECTIEQGRSADILLKILKHRFVENVSSETADNLGLSRAVLANDQLAVKLKELEKTASIINNIAKQFRRYIFQLKALTSIFKKIGDTFAEISERDNNESAFRSFTILSDIHRTFSNLTNTLIDEIQPIVDKLGTFINKAIPDTKLSFQKYLNIKFEYLSYCLKAREIEEEDADVAFDDTVVERLSSGNYYYRLQIKCRHLAKMSFNHSKANLLEKFELLDQKKVYELVAVLQQFSLSNTNYFKKCLGTMAFDDFNIEITDSLRTILNTELS